MVNTVALPAQAIVGVISVGCPGGGKVVKDICVPYVVPFVLVA